MDNVKTVLVVDDSRVSRLMSRQFILSRHPLWQIEEAASGEEALEKGRLGWGWEFGVADVGDMLTPDRILADIEQGLSAAIYRISVLVDLQ